MNAIGRTARRSAAALALSAVADRNRGLKAIAETIRSDAERVLLANKRDCDAGRNRGLSDAMLDRMLLDSQRIEAMARGVVAIADMPDPVGRVLAEWQRPNGLRIQRISVPLGVIGIVYESRPNVTIDAAALCLKAGNAVILRGGSESFATNMALHECVQAGLRAAGIDVSVVQMVPTTDRDAVGYLLSSMTQWLDVVVPRGGKSLIQRVQQDARVPVIGHLEGVCHVYVHTAANIDMARDVVLNAKMRRTGICGAAETLLIDRAIAARALPDIAAALTAAGCELRGDEEVCSLIGNAVPASDDDWSQEYLDAIISIRIVQSIEQAMQHIAEFGSSHTECIITDDDRAAERFCREVDSAIVLHNASTQFADGGEFGMGAEIGIATGRVHARGPVGAEQLTSFKYVVRGHGHVRS